MIFTPRMVTWLALATCSFSIQANSAPEYFTISGFIGSRVNQDIQSHGSDEVASVSSELTEALTIGWQYDTKSEGELLLSHSKQHFSFSEESTADMDVDVQYLHIGGKILFTNPTPFSTNIGVGMGITYFNPNNQQYDPKTALSANLSGGLRYQLSPQFALRSDLRVYGTRFHTEKALFCDGNNCLLTLDNRFYLQTEVMLGVEYKF